MDPWTKTTGERTESGRGGMGGTGESNEGKMGTTAIEQ